MLDDFSYPYRSFNKPLKFGPVKVPMIKIELKIPEHLIKYKLCIINKKK